VRHKHLYDVHMEILNLSDKTFQALFRVGISTVGGCIDHLNRGNDAMTVPLRGYGAKEHQELAEKVKAYGYSSYLNSEQVYPEPKIGHDFLYDVSLQTLELSEKPFKALYRTAISTIGDCVDFLNRIPDAMINMRGYGEKEHFELVEKLCEHGYGVYLNGEIDRLELLLSLHEQGYGKYLPARKK